MQCWLCRSVSVYSTFNWFILNSLIKPRLCFCLVLSRLWEWWWEIYRFSPKCRWAEQRVSVSFYYILAVKMQPFRVFFFLFYGRWRDCKTPVKHYSRLPRWKSHSSLVRHSFPCFLLLCVLWCYWVQQWSGAFKCKWVCGNFSRSEPGFMFFFFICDTGSFLFFFFPLVVILCVVAVWKRKHYCCFRSSVTSAFVNFFLFFCQWKFNVVTETVCAFMCAHTLVW